MKVPQFISNLFTAALVISCTREGVSGDTQAATTTNPSSSEPGSEVGADSAGHTTFTTEAEVTDSAPTPTTVIDHTTDAGCSFQGCDDMPVIPAECDAWAQDCPEGQKCAAFIAEGDTFWQNTHCVAVTGTDQPGEACTSKDFANGVDSCIEGAMCWNVDQGGVGTCFALCKGTPLVPVCDSLGTCNYTGALNLCYPFCNPLLQDCSRPEDVCYPAADYFTCSPDASGDEGQADDPCGAVNTCDKGLLCSEAAFVGIGCPDGATFCCTAFCEFPGGVCPKPGQECVQYYDPMDLPAPDLANIGTCGVPK